MYFLSLFFTAAIFVPLGAVMGAIAGPTGIFVGGVIGLVIADFVLDMNDKDDEY